MEETIKRLKEEGWTSEDIKVALLKMKEEAMEQPIIEGSLDDYLDSILYGEDVLSVENGQSTSFEIDSAKELFNMLDEKENKK